MGQFTLFAILLVLLAVAFAVSALWQRSRALALALALALPIAAGALYWHQGQPAALDPANVAAPKTIEEAIAQLERLTKAEPGDFTNQALLARAYMAAERFPDASNAYARALVLKPDETELSVEYAEAMLRSSSDRRFPPEAVRILESALQSNPQNQRALFFLGLHQRQAGQPAQAVETWGRLLSLLDASTSAALRAQIAEARKEAGLPELATEPALLTVEIQLDPTLAAAAGSNDTLYVFARQLDGLGPPFAVKRVSPGEWPLRIELGDGDSPMPTAKLSSQQEVLLGARLSRSGDAAPASGDLEADAVRVAIKPGQAATLVLNRTVP